MKAEIVKGEFEALVDACSEECVELFVSENSTFPPNSSGVKSAMVSLENILGRSKMDGDVTSVVVGVTSGEEIDPLREEEEFNDRGEISVFTGGDR